MMRTISAKIDEDTYERHERNKDEMNMRDMSQYLRFVLSFFDLSVKMSTQELEDWIYKRGCRRNSEVQTEGGQGDPSSVSYHSKGSTAEEGEGGS